MKLKIECMRKLNCLECGNVTALIENQFGIGKVICLDCYYRLEEYE